MLQKLLVGILLVVVGITVPLTQTAFASGMPHYTAGQLSVMIESATAKTSCITLAQKTTTRTDVALLALTRATQTYAKAHNGEIPDFNSPDFAQSAARQEILDRAVKTYRRYLQFIGYRMIVGRSADCTRTIVAFVGGGALHIVAEEELAQVVVEPQTNGTPQTAPDPGSTGPDPFALSDGVTATGACCSAINSFMSTLGLSAWGYTEVLAAFYALGITAPANPAPSLSVVVGALMLAGKGLVDLERAIENQHSGPGGPSGVHEGPSN